MRPRAPRPTDLPPHLAERCRSLNGEAVSDAGRYVLWWAHHALRDHENPALDVALEVADRLGLPVLAYAGLHGAHPYANDRHHLFILQSLREWQQVLSERGVRALVSLPVDGRPSPLAALAAESALVVAEEMPAPPFPAWNVGLARRSQVPVWAVDARCIVPMGLPGQCFDRAYRFREATRKALASRLGTAWPEAPASRGPAEPPAGIEDIHLGAASLPDLIARCPIDHTVPPVADTPGGSRAGYRRWREFLGQGLADYHRLRNDAAVAPPAGVSRLSAYLHYGCVSPFTVAREAQAHGGPGADKFLDELLVWRELAHNFCFHRPQALETLEALPDWARETLLAHETDPRPQLPGWERLARGRSGHALWDLAQCSLLRHGELHNNLRMTWGKALLEWTEGPAQGLATLLDLNHRYALDGCDPNSYGGILWCLGQFDRPFTPPQPVLGTVRPRPLAAHARRLDLGALARRVDRPNGRRLRVAVIGAGPAGALAARTLADQGHQVQVFDKGRGAGGRTATRRVGPWQFDHGAQYVTFRDPRLSRLRASWAAAGVVAPWGAAPEPATTRWVGVPGMSALVRHLLSEQAVSLGVEVQALERRAEGWRLRAAGARVEGAFDAVLLAVPAPQARALLEGHGALAERLAEVEMDPCWTALAVADQAALSAPSLALEGEGALAWVARDSTKPGRDPSGATWVLQAGPGWSRRHLEEAPEVVARLLWQALGDQVTDRLPEPGYLTAHRWRYARVARPLGEDCLWDATLALGACGDWCLAGRAEAALLSGAALAGRLMVQASGLE
jgi:hypothetical protein